MTDISLPAALLRGFATDFLTSHDVSEVRRIMSPDYQLSIAGVFFDGRDDAYLPATAAQLEEFPGLCVTVHDTILSPEAVAMRFTEHGVSAKTGRASAWGGVTLFEIEQGCLRRGWAEEDYFARKRQLKSGTPDPVCSPGVAPWDAPCEDQVSAITQAAASWLSDSAFISNEAVVQEISSGGPRIRALVGGAEAILNKVFSAGSRAAFHLDLVGEYAGGFEDIGSGCVGQSVKLGIAGMLDLMGMQVSRAQICADRLGLYRQLSQKALS